MIEERAPLVIGSQLALAFVLLLIAFRSVVVPATAIILNLRSVGAGSGWTSPGSVDIALLIELDAQEGC